MVLARPRARSMIKINSNNSLYHHSHFTEHLVDVFRKSPQESDLNHKSSSLLIRWLKSYTVIPYNNSHQNLWEITHMSKESNALHERTGAEKMRCTRTESAGSTAPGGWIPRAEWMILLAQENSDRTKHEKRNSYSNTNHKRTELDRSKRQNLK
jgi:hypothetical protein